MNKNFYFTVNTQASPEEVFAALLNVSKWWGFQDLEGQSKNLNDIFTITHPGTHYSKQVVTQLERNKKLVWSITESRMPWLQNTGEWTGTRLIFELTPGKLYFTHEGLTPDLECYARVSEGWREVIGRNLLDYLHDGKVRITYAVHIDLPKSASEVFRCICEPAQWWPEDFEGKSAQLDDEFVFRGGDAHFSRQRVIELIPDKKVVWLTIESIRKTDNFVWTGTKYSFELIPKNNATHLLFTYEGPVLENEHDRLAAVCDMVINDRLYNLVANSKAV